MSTTQPRWYMVNKEGMATLCKDKADAEEEAAAAQTVWPGSGPYRAAQLVEAGRASLSAEAGVDGWLQDGGLLYRLTDDRHPCNRDEINVTMADGSRSPESRARRAGELLDCIRRAAPPPALEGWVSVDERLPEPRQTVAFAVDAKEYEGFRYLHGRVLGGVYLPEQGFSIPGLSLLASHWMPLPEAPTPPSSAGKG